MAKTTYSHQTLAQDVMSGAVVVIREEETYRKAVELLTEKELTALPVVSKKGKLLGILTEKNILRQCRTFEEVEPNFLDQKIRFIRKIDTVRLDTPLEQVGSMLAHGSQRHVLVVDQDHILQGIISRRDLTRVIYLRLTLRSKG